jgi:hypothetical protein
MKTDSKDTFLLRLKSSCSIHLIDYYFLDGLEQPLESRKTNLIEI